MTSVNVPLLLAQVLIEESELICIWDTRKCSNTLNK